MGYMGLGMQRWIYTMKPRKPFSMDRKGSFTNIPKYHRDFKIQKSKKDFSPINWIIPVFVISIMIIVIKPHYMSYENDVHQNQLKALEIKNENAFSFLLKSGKDRLQHNNYVGAYSEFKLAHKIKPNHRGVQLLLFETINILCAENPKYCSELDTLQFQ